MKTDLLRFGVADNSLIVSAFIRPNGASSKALRKMGKELDLLAFEATLAELLMILTRPKFDRWVGYDRRMEIFSHYRDSVSLVMPNQTVVMPNQTVRECRDAKDDMLLELKLSGQADAIVTGDLDLLCLHPWRGIAILSPAEYLAR